MFKKIAFSLLAATASAAAMAGPQCTVYPEAERIPAEKFQEQLKAEGYQIKEFKLTKGSCYEIYGVNKDGQKVEIYFDTKTGEPVKSKVK